ncbi:MAG: alpha/beta fold hydrolase, partial [Actinomycetota bacterium]
MTERIRCFAVPGNGGSAARWQRLRSELPDDLDLRPVTLPGFGGRPLATERPTIADFARWLREEVAADEEAGAGPTVVLGHGIGGSILLEAAQQGPVADGYLLHAPVGPFLGDRLFPRLMRPPVVREGARRLISGPVGRLLLRYRFDAEMAADFARGYAECAAFSVLFDLLDEGWFDALGPIDTPAVLLWGAGDRVLSEEHRHG